MSRAPSISYGLQVISILSNCPLVVPTATTFRKYHQEHHSHLGVDGWDVDLPTFFEASWINTAVQKFLWVFCYIIVYGLRPMLVRPKSVGAQPSSSVESDCRNTTVAFACVVFMTSFQVRSSISLAVSVLCSPPAQQLTYPAVYVRCNLNHQVLSTQCRTVCAVFLCSALHVYAMFIG